MNDIIIVVDSSGRIRAINQTGLKFLGFGKKDLIGKSLQMLIPDRTGILEEKVLTEDHFHSGINTHLLTKTNKKIQATVLGVTLWKDADKTHTIVLLVHPTNESGKKNVDLSSFQNLDGSDEMIRTLAKFPEGNPNIILLAEKDGTIRYANKTGSQILKAWKRQIGEQLPEELCQVCSKVGESGKVNEMEIEYKNQAHMLLFSAMTDSNFVSIYGHDISERKKLEEMVFQSDRFVAMGRLVGGIAHELNNPLGVILGFSQSMVRRMNSDDPFFIFLDNISRESIRCKKLVEQLLTFSSTGRFEKESCDFNQVVECAVALVEPLINKKLVHLTKSFSPEIKDVEINSGQIQQAIGNICNNAMDAMPDGGSLDIRTYRKDENFVAIDVKDNGSGISKKNLPIIFDPFFTTKEVGEGAGLGLSLALEIIRRHQGKINVESEVGQGATFTVLIPAVQQHHIIS